MKILFICGCLEPGKDGVGDYTRLLAAELIMAGHQVFIIALYDSFISMKVKENQPCKDSIVKVLRLSKKLNAEDRLMKTKESVKSFNPNWVSLQFVAYSFQSKGLFFRLPFLLDKLSGKFRWHIMIHEPWLSGREIKFSHKVVGFLQKKLLKLILKKLDPIVIHTSNLYYQEILRKGGVKCSLLNLPGNIPIHKNDSPQILREFSELGITQNSRDNFLILGTFGTMRPQISYVALLESQIKMWGLKDKKLAFFSIGKTGSANSAIFSELKRKFEDKILLYEFGERIPSEISSFLQFLDYGVASVPYHLLGKSGVYAAMREHNLKILIPKNYSDGNSNLKIQKCKYSDYLLNLPNRNFSGANVASQFLNSLNLISNNNPKEIRENFTHIS